jgi:hypothetical protein
MTSYTAPELVLIIAAVGALIAQSLGAWRHGSKLDENTRATHATAAAVQNIDVKTAVIEGHVNSKEATYVAEIAGLRRENELLRKIVADAKETAALLAQATASDRVRTAAPPVTLGLPGAAG